MLPVSTDALASAVGVAEKCGSAFETWRFDEPPAVYLHTLEPFTTSTLLAQIAKSAETQDLLITRRDSDEVALGRGHVLALQSIDKQALMFTVRVEQTVTTFVTNNYRHEYAILLTRSGAQTWQVSAEISPAEDSCSGAPWIVD